MVFLEIQNVTLWSVFPNLVTYNNHPVAFNCVECLHVELIGHPHFRLIDRKIRIICSWPLPIEMLGICKSVRIALEMQLFITFQ